MKKAHAQAFTDHLNFVDEDTKWTTDGEVTTLMPVDEEEEMGVRTGRVLAFLNMWSVIKGNVSIKTRVFRKETHMDQ